MSFEKVRRRLQSRQFESFDEIRNSIELIWRNAKRYNVKESEIYEIARVYHVSRTRRRMKKEFDFF